MRKTIRIAGSVIVLAAVLVSAALVGLGLLRGPSPTDEGRELGRSADGKTMYQIADADIESAKEIPAQPPDVTGLVTKVENNSIYVGIGAKRDFGFSITGQNEYDASDFDAIVEVVITSKTEMYRDVTGYQVTEPGDKPAETQQQVAQYTLDRLRGQGLVMAWGERRGDRLIAGVVLCRVCAE